MLKQLSAAMLLCFLAISPLLAQNTAPLEAATNNAGSSNATPKSGLDRNLEKTRMDNEKDLEKTRLDNEKDLEKTRLDNEKDIEKTKLDNEKQMANSRADNHRSIVHDLAWNSWVVFAVLFGGGCLFFGNIRDQRRHETIRLMVEKGTPITPELLDGLRKKPRLTAGNYDPKGHLCWGVTETLVAIALLYAFPHGGAHTAGWIVLAVGVANLILWVIERAHSDGNSGQPK